MTCGKGLRQRSRRYRQPQRASEKGCSRQLVFKEMCVAPIPECESDSEDSGENLAKSEATVNERGDGLGVCKTTPWSDWSECSGKLARQAIIRNLIILFLNSATCGVGISMRTRTFLDRVGRKKCPHITVGL